MFKVGDIVQGISSIDSFYSSICKGKVIEVLEEKDSLILEILQHANHLNNNTIVEVNNCCDYLEYVDDTLNSTNILSLIFEHKLNNEKDIQGNMSNLSSSVSNIKSQISNTIKEINKVTTDVFNIKKDSNLVDKLVEELNLIQSDKKCDEVNINEDCITITTKQLYIEDKEHPEGLFKMNKYDICIYLKDLYVKVYGLLEDYNRESCWSNNCPHPHISHSGNPCWGNTQAMLVDSMKNKDLYTTFMLVINFLETFNLSDVAGKNIRNWDFVSKDDDSEILENPYFDILDGPDCGCEIEDYDEDYDGYICAECGRTVCIGCVTRCDNCNDYICNEHTTHTVGEEDICQGCIDEYYVFAIDTEEYIHRDDANICDYCGEYFEKDLEETIDEDCEVCDCCAGNHYVYSNYHDCYIYAEDSQTCGCCNDYFAEYVDLTHIPSESCSVCEDCLDEHYVYIENEDIYIDKNSTNQCDCCEKFFTEDLIYLDSEEISVCEECLNSKYECSDEI